MKESSQPEHLEETQTFAQKYYLPVLIVGLVVALLVSALPWMGEVGVADPKTADTGGLWINFLGRFHPLMLHLPIGAVVLVLCMETVSIFSRGSYKSQTTLALAFAAGSAIFAVVLGYFWYLTGGYNGPTVEDHKRDGVIFTVLMILTFLVKFSCDAKAIKTLKPGYYLLLGLSAATMMSAGHHGGEMSHGDPFNSLPSKILAEREAKKDIPVATDPVIYTNIIHPILENKCISCHGDDKDKGGLRLDTMAAMLSGGDTEDCLIKGDVEGSYMLTTMNLPKDDDMHMPPKEKPQMTDEEIEILTWWVSIGAPDDTKISEVEVPDSIQVALLTLKSPEELAAEAKAILDAEIALNKALKSKRENHQEILDKVDTEFPGSLRYRSQQETVLNFTVVSYRKDFSDSSLDLLASLAEDVVDMDLSETSLTDQGVAKLAKFKNLEKLKINGTDVTNESLKVLSTLPKLRSLNIYGTAVDDAGLEYFLDHPELNNIYLWETNVTDLGAKKLLDKLTERNENSTDGSRKKPSVDLGKPN